MLTLTKQEANAAYTPEMLAYWQKNFATAKGPFAEANVPTTNAPNQRQSMVDGKNAFMANQTRCLWKVPGTGVVNQHNTSATGAVEGVLFPSSIDAINLVHAAQYGLIAKDTAVTAAVVAALMRQCHEPSTNWKRSAGPFGAFGDESKTSDNGRFANNDWIADGGACIWQYTEWFIRQCHAYWFICHAMTAAQQADFQAWANNFGEFAYLERRSIDSLWTNRLAEFAKDAPNVGAYGPYLADTNNDSVNTRTNADGTPGIHYSWPANDWFNNRRSKIMAATTHAGIVAGNAKLVKYGITCAQELLVVFFGQDGTIAEHNRANSGWPSKGLNYAVSTMFTWASVGDYLARYYGLEQIFRSTTRLGFGVTEFPKPNVSKTAPVAGTVDKDFAMALESFGKYLTGEYKFLSADGLPINGRSGDGTDYQQSDVTGEAIAWNFYGRIGHPRAQALRELARRTRKGIYGYQPGSSIQGQGSVTGIQALNMDLPNALWLYEGLIDAKVRSFPSEKVVTPSPPPPPVKKDQHLSLSPIPDMTVGQTFTLAAKNDAGRPWTSGSANPAIAAVSGDQLKAVTPGTTMIVLNAPGDADYNAALPVSQPVTVKAPVPVSDWLAVTGTQALEYHRVTGAVRVKGIAAQ